MLTFKSAVNYETQHIAGALGIPEEGMCKQAFSLSTDGYWTSSANLNRTRDFRRPIRGHFTTVSGKRENA
jgi:hypothetical protein